MDHSLFTSLTKIEIVIELEIVVKTKVKIKVSSLFKSKTFLKTPERETTFCITNIYLI